MDLEGVLVSKHIRAGKKRYSSRILEVRFLVTGHKEPGASGDAGEEKTMRRSAVVLVAVGTLVIVPVALAEHGSAWPPPPGPVLGPGDSVPICHATGSETNPFVANHPSSAGVLNGHWGSDHQGGEDIIPPFQFQQNANAEVDQTASSGQNWDAEGQALWANECELAEGGGAGGNPPPPPEPPSGGGAGAGGGGGGGSLGGEAAGGGGQGALPFTGLPFAVLGLAGLALLLGGLGLMRSGRTR
jgi:hypothetical protein